MKKQVYDEEIVKSSDEYCIKNKIIIYNQKAKSKFNQIDQVQNRQQVNSNQFNFLLHSGCFIAENTKEKVPRPPSGLPEASLWFDPSDIQSITINNGILTNFVDKTGNNNNGFSINNNTVYNVNPINGKGTVRIDNSSGPVECLKVTNSNFNESFISYAFVVNYISGQSGFLGTDRPGFFGRGIGVLNGLARTISYNAFTTWNSINIPYNTPTIIVASISASDWILSVNGVQNALNLVQAKLPDNNVGFNIGCWNPTNFFDIKFDCGEVLVYKSFLTPEQIQKVETYLSNKWNINLPQNHPANL